MSYKCPKCGVEIRETVKFCPECGTAQKTPKHPPKNSSNTKNKISKRQSGSGMNIIYLVTLLSVIVVGIYGYKYVSPNNSSNPHANVPRSVAPAQTPAFDEEHYQHLLAEVNANPSGFDENVHLANFLFDNQRFNEATKYYENALKINSQAVDVLVDAGVSYFNLNQFEEAKIYFGNALKVDSQHINALYNMGVVSARLGNMQDMQTYWIKLIEVAPDSEQARAAQQMLDQVRNSSAPNP